MRRFAPLVLPGSASGLDPIGTGAGGGAGGAADGGGVAGGMRGDLAYWEREDAQSCHTASAGVQPLIDLRADPCQCAHGLGTDEVDCVWTQTPLGSRRRSSSTPSAT